MLNTEERWTAARITELRRLWADGYSATQIEGTLDGGFSRSAVLGKVHRLGLEPRRSAYSQPKERKPRAVPVFDFRRSRAEKAARQHGERIEPPPIVLLECRPCGLLDLTADTCRYPIGDPGKADFHFCGAQPRSGKPYCAFHHKIAHAPPPTKVRSPFIPRRAA